MRKGNYFKRVVSLMLTVVMVLAMTTVVSAYTITAPADNGHTYEVYQIFTGDLSTDGTILSNVKWGKNGTGIESAAVDETVLNELKAVNNKSDSEKLAVIKIYANLTAANKYGTVISGTPLENVPAGYYLIKDVDGALDNTHDAYTHYIVEVVNDVTIAAKSGIPTVNKTVNAKKADDVNIGDNVNFVLTATLPAKEVLEDYTTYKVVFNDTLSAGLTYNRDAVVKLNNATITKGYFITPVTDATTEITTLTIAINDVKTIGTLTGGDTITVEYTAKLNSGAVIGNDIAALFGNQNTVDLDYSNDPNNSDADHTPKGDTPDDSVAVFTYELDVEKVDGVTDTTKLQGAEFTLHRINGSNTEYVQVDTNNRVTGWTTDTTQASTLTSGTDGKFKIVGLDQGTYYLTETKAPNGYNKLTKPIIVTIHATISGTDGAEQVTALSISVDDQLGATVDDIVTSGNGNVSTGVVATTIKNNAGSTLPETGGIGTRIFYIVGAVLALGAGVVLITRRRMKDDE